MKDTDLHTHSYYSDGQISPKELVRQAKRKKIKNLALTDHDSVDGVKEAIKEGKRLGVGVIPAVEVRAKETEVLGYFVDVDNKELKKDLKKGRKKVKEGVKDWCKKLQKAGFNISFKEIQGKFPKSKSNINEFYPLFVLYKKGYGKMLKIPGIIKERGVKKKKIKERTMIQAIRLIKKAGGVPVLAHPWVDDKRKVLRHKNIKRYIEAGLKGIEINNGDRAPFKPSNMNKKIRKIAKKYKLILTCGSDYHGLPELTKQMPGNHELGENNCDKKIVEQLQNLSNIK
jgi:hypothetical protein|tara:strand:+ start:309 stop:1163 length:855 start_codon:yes stop_codon:yes gene_type:complete